MATHHFSSFFSHLKNLTRLNVNGSVVDDGCFRVIGENCDKLIELDAGDTYISNVGLTYLSFDEIMPVMQCLPGLQIYRYILLVQRTYVYVTLKWKTPRVTYNLFMTSKNEFSNSRFYCLSLKKVRGLF